MTAFTVWLTISIAWPDAEPWITKTRQPDITTCMVKAAQILHQASIVRSAEPYRVRAECMMEWPGEDPA